MHTKTIFVTFIPQVSSSFLDINKNRLGLEYEMVRTPVPASDIKAKVCGFGARTTDDQCHNQFSFRETWVEMNGCVDTILLMAGLLAGRQAGRHIHIDLWWYGGEYTKRHGQNWILFWIEMLWCNVNNFREKVMICMSERKTIQRKLCIQLFEWCWWYSEQRCRMLQFRKVAPGKPTDSIRNGKIPKPLAAMLSLTYNCVSKIPRNSELNSGF